MVTSKIKKTATSKKPTVTSKITAKMGTLKMIPHNRSTYWDLTIGVIIIPLNHS
jgi:hypothetical protein